MRSCNENIERNYLTTQTYLAKKYGLEAIIGWPVGMGRANDQGKL